jgi:MFS transporter, PHS family, inorganic phosphate transporter
LVGCFTTLLIPETKRKTLEELTGEDHWLNMEVPANGDHSANLYGSNSENEKAV